LDVRESRVYGHPVRTRLTGRDRELADQVKRLKSEYRVASYSSDPAALDPAALAGLQDETWRLLRDLFPVVLAGDDVRLASLLADLARMCLPLEMDAGNWARVIAACAAMNLAVHTIQDTPKGFYRTRLANFKMLFIDAPTVAEAAAYAALRAGDPAAALGTLEHMTGMVYERRMEATAKREMDQKRASTPGAQAAIEQAAARQTEARATVQQGNLADTTQRQTEETILAVLSVPELPDPLDQYRLTSSDAHAVRAARLTGRTIVYVVPGYRERDGVAIRVNRDRAERNLVEGALLPGFTTASVEARTDAVRTAFGEFLTDDLASGDLDERLRELQDWTGASAWEAISAAWPDLAARRLALIPVGPAALLPLYTATVGGAPACTRMDLTLTPSARALHYAAIRRTANTPRRPLIAADHWGRPDYLPHVDDEARAIAAIYGTEPVLCETDTAKALGGHRSLRTVGLLAGLPVPGLSPASAEIAARMREATVVHLSCHGVLRDITISPALLLGGIMQLTQILQVDKRTRNGEQRELGGHPLIVLSACELGGFPAMGVPAAEQHGFPAGFMALGARAVVGSLWPVPDGRPTIRLMEDFHRRLADLPSNLALSAVIAQAHRDRIRPYAWGSLSHYGL
jgi:hypothetical protein